MIYKLVCAGDNHFIDLYKKDENEIIIAVDGGYKVLNENNINTNIGKNKKPNTIHKTKLSTNLLCFITYLLNHPSYHLVSYKL